MTTRMGLLFNKGNPRRGANFFENKRREKQILLKILYFVESSENSYFFKFFIKR